MTFHYRISKLSNSNPISRDCLVEQARNGYRGSILTTQLYIDLQLPDLAVALTSGNQTIGLESDSDKNYLRLQRREQFQQEVRPRLRSRELIVAGVHQAVSDLLPTAYLPRHAQLSACTPLRGAPGQRSGDLLQAT